jgi:pilus assembly protein Flp/PilA
VEINSFPWQNTPKNEGKYEKSKCRATNAVGRGISPAKSLPRSLTHFGRCSAVFRSFLHDDSGQGLVEYSLIVALVAIVAIASLQLVGQSASNTLSNAAGYLS